MLVLLNRNAAGPDDNQKQPELQVTARRDSFTHPRSSRDLKPIDIGCEGRLASGNTFKVMTVTDER